MSSAELTRIVVDPAICFGKPTIRGHRIWVSLILGYLAEGWTPEQIVDEYPRHRQRRRPRLHRLRRPLCRRPVRRPRVGVIDTLLDALADHTIVGALCVIRNGRVRVWQPLADDDR